jgi:hypothetical protein
LPFHLHIKRKYTISTQANRRQIAMIILFY